MIGLAVFASPIAPACRLPAYQFMLLGMQGGSV
jgi:hypothetical protein